MARTTTTVIRTTQNRSARRRAGKPARKRASTSRSKSRTSRAKPRKARLTTTLAQRTAYKESANKTNWLPILGLAGLLGLGAFLFARPLLAQPNDPNKPDPNKPINPPPPGGGGDSPGGFVHPPAGTRATISATVGVPAGATPGLKLRPAPAPGGATVGADLPNGTAITVVRSNVVENGRTAANKERWWEVRTGDNRTGYVRAVGPGAKANDPYVWNVSFPGQQTATGYMAAPVQLQANYTQVIRGYDAYNRPVDQFGRLIVMRPAADPYQALVVRQAWGR